MWRQVSSRMECLGWEVEDELSGRAPTVSVASLADGSAVRTGLDWDCTVCTVRAYRIAPKCRILT